MQSNLLNVTYEIELRPGEKLALPPTLVDVIGAGRWVWPFFHHPEQS